MRDSNLDYLVRFDFHYYLCTRIWRGEKKVKGSLLKTFCFLYIQNKLYIQDIRKFTEKHKLEQKKKKTQKNRQVYWNRSALEKRKQAKWKLAAAGVGAHILDDEVDINSQPIRQSRLIDTFIKHKIYIQISDTFTRV